MNLNEPVWVRQARKYNGLKEIKGPKHNIMILKWLKDINAWYANDEEAWCGTFLGGIFTEVKIPIPALAMTAKRWATWGQPVEVCVGAVGVKTRKGGGHVTLIIGRTADGFLLGLGGNQNDGVNIAKFDPSTFIAFRYPPRQTLPIATGFHTLPVMTMKGEVLKNEA